MDTLSYEIEHLRERFAVLIPNPDYSSTDNQEILVGDELSNALAELEVIVERLRHEHEAILGVRIARESKAERYQDLFDFAPDVYLVTDSNGLISEANCAAATLLNTAQHLLVGTPLTNFVSPEKRPQFHSQLDQLKEQNGAVQEWEMLMYRAQGEPLPVVVRVASCLERHSTLSSLLWIVRDISAQKQIEYELRTTQAELETRLSECQAELKNTVAIALAEATKRQKLQADLELRVQERTAQLQQAIARLETEITERQCAEQAMRESVLRFRNLVETTSDWVWEIDPTGAYTYVSPKIYDILGYTPEEIIGKTPFDLMPAKEAWRVSSILGGLVAQQKSFTSIEISKIHKNGHLVILEMGAVPIYDVESKFSGYRGINRDITERKHSEQALRQQALAFENTYDSIIITDLEGLIIDCNLSTQWMFGYSKEEFVGKNLTFLQSSPESSILKEQILNELIQKDRWSGEINFTRKDGTQGVCETIFVLFCNDEGDQLAAIGVSHDITSRKRAEEEICKTLAKEKELNILKSRFLSMASHEFRTPLSTILTSSDILKSFGYKLSESKKIQQLNKIQAEVKRMTQLLNDVLLVGKTEAAKLEFQPIPLDIKAFCQEVLDEIALTDKQFHQFVFDYYGKDFMGNMDEKLLRHILTNLLSNAVKYSPEGTTVKLKLVCENEQAILKVQDQGIGIPEADQEHLFEVFYRASNVGNISGTGLGMTIIKSGVDLHHGTITFESELGVGTTFTVSLPLHAH